MACLSWGTFATCLFCFSYPEAPASFVVLLASASSSDQYSTLQTCPTSESASWHLDHRQMKHRHRVGHFIVPTKDALDHLIIRITLAWNLAEDLPRVAVDQQIAEYQPALAIWGPL